MRNVDGGRDGDRRVAGAEAELEGALLLRLRLEEREELLGRLSLVGTDPVGVEDRIGVIGPERPFLGIDGDERLRRRRLAGVRLDDEVFVEDRSRDVRRATLQHLLGEEAGRLAVVHDGAFDRLEELPRRDSVEVGGVEAARLLRAGIGLGEHGEEPGVRELGMSMSELEAPPLGEALRAPALGIGADLEEVGPPDRLAWPSERLGHGLPHRDHHRRQHDDVTGRRERLRARGLRGIRIVEERDVRL